jgi:hypothetical protein
MNRKLHSLYTGLQPADRARLKHTFADSPKALALLRFLEGQASPRFRNEDVVLALYPDESTPEVYPQLENRYYKLRKKLLDAIEGLAMPDISLLTPEETELYTLRQLLQQGQPEEAQRRLQALCEKTEADHIYEVWAPALDLLVLANQVRERHENNLQIFEKLEKASELLAAVILARCYCRQVYEHFTFKGAQAAKPYLEKLRKLALKYKDSPRIQVIAQAETFYMGIEDPDFRDPKYLRMYKQLQEVTLTHPNMPWLNYGPNHILQSQHRFRNNSYTYFNLIGDYKGFLSEMEAAWELATRPNSGSWITDKEHRNRVYGYIMMGRFEDALKAAQEMVDFQKGRNEKPYQGYEVMAFVFIYGFPKLRPENRTAIIASRLREYYKMLQKNKDYRRQQDIASVLSAFLFVGGQFAEAYKLLKGADCQRYYTERGLKKETELTYKFFAEKDDLSKTEYEKALNELQNSLSDALSNEQDPRMLSSLRKLEQFLALHTKHQF